MDFPRESVVVWSDLETTSRQERESVYHWELVNDNEHASSTCHPYNDQSSGNSGNGPWTRGEEAARLPVKWKVQQADQTDRKQHGPIDGETGHAPVAASRCGKAKISHVCRVFDNEHCTCSPCWDLRSCKARSNCTIGPINLNFGKTVLPFFIIVLVMKFTSMSARDDNLISIGKVRLNSLLIWAMYSGKWGATKSKR